MTPEDRALLMDVHQKTIATHTKVESLEKNVGVLFKSIEGNGQPGLKQKMTALETRHDALAKSHEDCKRSRDEDVRGKHGKWPNILMAACAVAALVISVIALV